MCNEDIYYSEGDVYSLEDIAFYRALDFPLRSSYKPSTLNKNSCSICRNVRAPHYFVLKLSEALKENKYPLVMCSTCFYDLPLISKY